MSRKCKARRSTPRIVISLRNRWSKSKKAVKFDCSLSPCGCCPVTTNAADIVDIGQEQSIDVAVEIDCRWYGLPARSAALAQVRDTSAGVLGYARVRSTYHELNGMIVELGCTKQFYISAA